MSLTCICLVHSVRRLCKHEIAIYFSPWRASCIYNLRSNHCFLPAQWSGSGKREICKWELNHQCVCIQTRWRWRAKEGGTERMEQLDCAGCTSPDVDCDASLSNQKRRNTNKTFQTQMRSKPKNELKNTFSLENDIFKWSETEGRVLCLY